VKIDCKVLVVDVRVLEKRKKGRLAQAQAVRLAGAPAVKVRLDPQVFTLLFTATFFKFPKVPGMQSSDQ
jgi:hypothetical protein